MIKTKIIETSKATILVIGGLPEDVDKWDTVRTLRGDVIISCDKKDKDKWGEYSNPRYIFDIPPGNWQPLGFLENISEDVAKELVDIRKETSVVKECYLDYIDTGMITWLSTAKESLSSLIEDNLLLKNQFGNWDDFDKLIYNHSGERLKEWKEEQEKVFINPFLLKKTN